MEHQIEDRTPSTYTMLGLMSVFITVPLGIDAAIPEIDMASPTTPEQLYQLTTAQTLSESAAMRRESSVSALKTKSPRWFWSWIAFHSHINFPTYHLPTYRFNISLNILLALPFFRSLSLYLVASSTKFPPESFTLHPSRHFFIFLGIDEVRHIILDFMELLFFFFRGEAFVLWRFDFYHIASFLSFLNIIKHISLIS